MCACAQTGGASKEQFNTVFDCLSNLVWTFGPIGYYAYELDNIDTARALQACVLCDAMQQRCCRTGNNQEPV